VLDVKSGDRNRHDAWSSTMPRADGRSTTTHDNDPLICRKEQTMERLSTILRRLGSQLEPQDDGFQDTVPCAPCERVPVVGSSTRWEHDASSPELGHPVGAAPCHRQAGFADTVPFELASEEPAPGEPAMSGPGTPQPAQMPAHLRRQALAPIDKQATAVALPYLRGVGIGDLRQVSSHITDSEPGGTRHTVHFHNGGFVRFGHGIDGSIVELSGERITVRVGVNGDVLITAHLPSDVAEVPQE
jgi:hypothetical protein